MSVLHELAIIGAPLETGEAVFRAGDGFARHVIFAGCSPYLKFAPADAGDRQFCHVAVHADPERILIVTGGNTVKPRCPECRGRFTHWSDELPRWLHDGLVCDHCGTRLAAAELDWRQHAAVGHSLIELRNVFPGEASPSDTLVAALQTITGCDWRHAWAGYFPGLHPPE